MALRVVIVAVMLEVCARIEEKVLHGHLIDVLKLARVTELF
jgi:hypothetical protein